jgi:hypothetical protein
MTEFLRAEEIGIYDRNGFRLSILKSGTNSTYPRRLTYSMEGHFGDMLSIYNNEFNPDNEFVKNVTDLAKNHIKKQVVTRTEEFLIKGIPVIETSTLEFADGSKLGPVMVGCSTPVTLLSPYSDKEILIEDTLYAEGRFKQVDNILKKKRAELKARKPQRFENLEEFLRTTKEKILIEANEIERKEAYNNFREIKKLVKFRDIKSLKYEKHKQEPKVNDTEYSKWKLSSFDRRESVVSVMGGIPIGMKGSLIGIFREDGKSGKYEIEIEETEQAYRNLNKWVDNERLKEIVKDIDDERREVSLEGCKIFIHRFLEKSGVKVEDVYLDGKLVQDFVVDETGRVDSSYLLLKPKNSFVTLSNESEKRTVEAPLKLAVVLGLENSNVVNVKVEKTNGLEKPAPPYIA